MAGWACSTCWMRCTGDCRRWANCSAAVDGGPGVVAPSPVAVAGAHGFLLAVVQAWPGRPVASRATPCG